MKLKFDKMTKAQKRVAIAKDVLKQIRAKRFNIQSGNFWDVRGVDSARIRRSDLRSNKAVCRCCAAGSAVLSGIRLFNNKSIPRQWDFGDSAKLRNRWFSIEELALIESAFESDGVYNLRDELSHYDFCKGVEFAKKSNSFTARAIAIFQNIIDNKGAFKP